MVIAELLATAADTLKDVDNGAFEAREITASILGLSNAELIIHRADEVTAENIAQVTAALKRRVNGEPMQYILMSAEFMSLPFRLNRDTLIPRADTETLVETVIDRLPEGEVELLDLCTGSGCVAVSIAYYNRKVHATGVDISANAIAAARENAVLNGVGERVAFEVKDVMTETPSCAYDCITANPPYIKSAVIPTLQREVREYEPMRALDGGADGLIFYRRIVAAYTPFVRKGGILAFEIDRDDAENVRRLMSGAYETETVKDLCGNDRVVVGRKI